MGKDLRDFLVGVVVFACLGGALCLIGYLETQRAKIGFSIFGVIGVIVIFLVVAAVEKK